MIISKLLDNILEYYSQQRSTANTQKKPARAGAAPSYKYAMVDGRRDMDRECRDTYTITSDDYCSMQSRAYSATVPLLKSCVRMQK